MFCCCETDFEVLGLTVNSVSFLGVCGSLELGSLSLGWWWLKEGGEEVCGGMGGCALLCGKGRTLCMGCFLSLLLLLCLEKCGLKVLPSELWVRGGIGWLLCVRGDPGISLVLCGVWDCSGL